MKYTETNKRQRHKEHCSRVNPIRQIAPGSTGFSWTKIMSKKNLSLVVCKHACTYISLRMQLCAPSKSKSNLKM